LLARARQGAGYRDLSDTEYLLKRKLADRRGRGLSLRRAAELLFATHGPDHPNAGVRVFRVIGTERRLGVEHNVEERPRVEGNLAEVVDEATTLIASLLRRPSRLRGLRFQPMPEYPEFSWKEAVLNAIAHRDYSVEGNTTEVWLFEDRMEVVSPGSLLPDLSIDELLSMTRVHKSRNPRVVRVLVDLGVVRDQGEGIPRMFAEMEGQFLPAPEIQSTRRGFTVVLRNTPTLSPEDRAFVASLGSNELSDTEFRALLEAHRHGRVDNPSLRRIAGLDTLDASRLLGALRDRELLSLHGGGAKSYYTLGRVISRIDPTSVDRPQLDADRPQLDADRPQLEALSAGLQEMVSSLGARPRRSRLWPTIAALCAQRAYRPAELASVLGFRRPKLLVRRHLTPMVDAGLLERTHPDTSNHPDQAYRTVSEPGEDTT